jgi:uncharacterized membrane protein
MDSCLVLLLGATAITALMVAIHASQRARAASREIERLRGAIDSLEKKTTAQKPEGVRTSAPMSQPTSSPIPSAPTIPPLPRFEPPPRNPSPSPSPKAPLQPSRPAKLVFEPSPQPVFPPMAASRIPFDWEALVGVKLFSWIAGVALVLAVVFFLRYSVEHGWLSPVIRATIGIIVGSALIVVSEMRIARAYKTTVNAMHGAGIAILYGTLFAMYALWHLAPVAVVFGAMLFVTAVAVALSIRRDSIFISLLGLLGGFATPALLSTGENHAVGLFTYLLLLNIALAWVASTKRWPVLTGLSIVLTAIYQWTWIGKFLTVAQFPLAAGIFLGFGLAAGAGLWIGRHEDNKQQTFDVAAIAGSALPLLFAVFGAAVPAYGSRYNVLFGFLFLITCGLAIVALLRGPQWLHLLGGMTTLIVFTLWVLASYQSVAWPAILGWLVLFAVAQYAAAHFSHRPDLTIAPLLMAMLPALIGFERATASPVLIFGTAFALLALAAAYAIKHNTGAVYFVASFFIIACEVVWSAKYLSPARLLSALAIYAIFGGFFIGLPMIARRFGRTWATGNAVTALVLATVGLLFFLAVEPLARIALWGLALLLAIINAGALLEARTTAHPMVVVAPMLLSWLVIAAWCSSAMTATTIVPGLVVIGGFALLALAGNAWASTASNTVDNFADATFLVLGAHVFLMAIASQKALAFPPWPLFAVLFVLDLAIGFAASYVRRAPLMIAAMAASQLILMIWSTNASSSPWPLVALIATLTISALALTWFVISETFATAAIVALFLSGLTAIIAGQTASVPLFGPLLAAHGIIAAAILFVAWRKGWHELAVAAVPLTAFATVLSRAATAADRLSFATVMYALFIAYPLLLGSRAKRSFQPYLAAVLAGVPFFFFARRVIIDLRLDYAIGLLPLFQALLMIVLLLRLLKIEAPSDRVLSRLAVVAGAALAFITVAIPLQLEEEWVTIGWALEAAALVWLFRRVPHRGLLLWSGGLFAGAFVRLAFNRAIFEYHPVSQTPVFNWYLYTYAICAASFFIGARLWPRIAELRWSVKALSACGAILLFFLVNIEIADFYSTGQTLTFNFFSSSLAQDLTYTIGWAMFAVGMLIAGIMLRTRSSRVAAILLLVATVLKCFLHDLARLGGLYRVGSLLGLAVSLVIVGVLLQKFVLTKTTLTPTADAS